MQDDEALTMSCGAHIDLYTAPLPEEDTVVLRAWPSVRLMVRQVGLEPTTPALKGGTRTYNLLRVKQALFQLSYTSIYVIFLKYLLT